MKTQRKIEHYGLKSHEARFGTEEKCRQYLAELRWENGVPTCPDKECKNMYMNYYISSRKIWCCSRCKKQFSLTKGTIFESSNLPLTLWFKAIYYFTIHKRGISSCQLARDLEIEQRTAWFMLHRLRETLNNNENLNLEGEVEVDETFIAPILGKDVRLQSKKQKHDAEQEKIHGLSDYKKRKLRGYPLKTNRQKGVTKEVIEQRKIEKALLGERKNFEQPIVVFGILQRNGKIHLEVLGKGDGEARKENIFPIIKRHVTSKSIIVSDQSSIYKTIKKFFEEHQFVNHSKGYVIKGIHINGIENVFKHLKKMIKGTFFHIKLHHFQNYLFEHSFRWNVLKKSDREKIDEFLPNLGRQHRLKYGDLISRTFNPLNFAA
ncbi:MAG: IS1595 family transposase [Vicingus serpentipes]|nr:IS1595 family transposase [Vicingus serpentipes]